MHDCIAERRFHFYCIATTTQWHRWVESCYHVATQSTHLFPCSIPCFSFMPRQTCPPANDLRDSMPERNHKQIGKHAQQLFGSLTISAASISPTQSYPSPVPSLEQRGHGRQAGRQVCFRADCTVCRGGPTMTARCNSRLAQTTQHHRVNGDRKVPLTLPTLPQTAIPMHPPNHHIPCSPAHETGSRRRDTSTLLPPVKAHTRTRGFHKRRHRQTLRAATSRHSPPAFPPTRTSQTLSRGQRAWQDSLP
jgi:hypothetical protein